MTWSHCKVLANRERAESPAKLAGRPQTSTSDG